MANILIIYDSESDRRFTELAVPYVKEGVDRVSGMEVRVRHVDEATTEDVFWANGMAIGCPTHLGGVSWKMKRWWDERTPDIWFKTMASSRCLSLRPAVSAVEVNWPARRCPS